MGSSYFTLHHETLEILNEFPVLRELSHKHHFGLEKVSEDGKTLLESLQELNYTQDEINFILRRMNQELDRVYK